MRQKFIEAKLSRRVINYRVNRIRRVFKWGVENQLVAPQVLHAIQAVSEAVSIIPLGFGGAID